MILYYISLPVIFPAYLAGSLKWGHRLGYGYKPCDRQGCQLWLHASSMGEVKVMGILIGQLRKIDPNLSLYITVMTDTGYQSALDLVSKNTAVGYIPLDSRPAINRFLKTVNPARAAFIETEIWPNIITALGHRRIPVFLANGRLSEKAAGRYRLVRSGLGRVFEQYTAMMVQSEEDRERFISVGARLDGIDVLGNLKFDAPMTRLSDERIRELKNSLPFGVKAKLFIAGSTRGGENEIIINVFKKLAGEFPDVRLILVPRHLERVGSIRLLCDTAQVKYRLFSQEGITKDDPMILVVDSMGVLNDLYSVSDIAFVGGTLVDIGGQNILEPVWAGIPVLYGPSIFNVRDSSAYITGGRFGKMVTDGDDLYRHLVGYFRGELTFRTKNRNEDENSRAFQTARKILGPAVADGKTVADNNQ